MIKYKLICKDCESTFDSWFSSSKEYERIKKRNFLIGHICNSPNVRKTLMSPSVLMSKDEKETQKYRETRKLVSKYQQFIKKNFDYVGENFSYEARSIHYKNKKSKKGIYGTATKEDLKELKEEGIEIEMVPWIKNTTN